MKNLRLLFLLPAFVFLSAKQSDITECYAPLNLKGDKREIQINKEKLMELRDGINISEDLCTGKKIDSTMAQYYRMIFAPLDGLASLVVSTDGKFPEAMYNNIDMAVPGDRFLFEGIKATINGKEYDLKKALIVTLVE